MSKNPNSEGDSELTEAQVEARLRAAAKILAVGAIRAAAQIKAAEDTVHTYSAAESG